MFSLLIYGLSHHKDLFSSFAPPVQSQKVLVFQTVLVGNSISFWVTKHPWKWKETVSSRSNGKILKSSSLLLETFLISFSRLGPGSRQGEGDLPLDIPVCGRVFSIAGYKSPMRVAPLPFFNHCDSGRPQMHLEPTEFEPQQDLHERLFSQTWDCLGTQPQTKEGYQWTLTTGKSPSSKFSGVPSQEGTSAKGIMNKFTTASQEPTKQRPSHDERKGEEWSPLPGRYSIFTNASQ